QDYCYITSDKDFDKDGKFTKDCDLTDDAKKYVLHSLIGDGTGTNTECELMWFFNPDNPGVMENGVVLNCSAMGFGNSLVFSGKTKDNLSAGTQRVKSNDSDKKYQYCKDVFYCGEDGKMDKLFVQIGAEMTGGSDAAINMYPEVTALEIENEGHTVIMPINQPVGTVLFKDYDYFNVQKDPAEQLNFTYQLHLVTHNPDLIIGAGWANNCPLVVDRPNAVTLKYWHLNRPLPKGMQTMSSGWGEPLKTSPITNIDYAKGYFKIDANSCVTDAKNNVIVAYNGENPCTFYLKYTHDYDKLTQEYNSLNAGRYKDATYNINN
ncbi:MAG: hypothetical protein J1G02_06585, partial [Clostridiales bacterium]|nr:hypothetical protein [Clostridiales bacterium]